MPEQDMVVAITSGVKNMSAILNVVWDKLLPAVSDGQLPADDDGVAALQGKLAGLKMATAQGEATSPEKFVNRKYAFPANDQKLESVELVSKDGGKILELVTVSGGVESRTPCAHAEWATSRSPFGGGHLAQFADEPIASSFAWQSDDRCVIKQIAYETPFTVTLSLSFAGANVTVEGETNVAFGATKRPTLVGVAE
jgi:hypothetical protein